MRQKLLCVVLAAFSLSAIEQLREGNLLLRDSLQPSPMFAIGQNIFDRREMVWQTPLLYFKGPHLKNLTLGSGFIYAPNDHSSVYVVVPGTLFNEQDCERTRMLNDIFLQCEYCYYKKEARTYTAELTLVSDIFWTTDGGDTPLHQGSGVVSFYVGGTASITHINWYAYADAGVFMPTKDDVGTQFGKSVFYEWGVGHNIFARDKTVITGILVFNGIFSEPDIIRGRRDRNSGSNILYAGGELYSVYEPYVLQVGIQWPIMQKLKGDQPKIDYRFGVTFSWVFSFDGA